MFKIRCSAIGDIMAQMKNGVLPKGAQTYCKNWVKEQRYGRRKDIWTKELQKGNECEKGAIELVTDTYHLGMISGNEEWFEGDEITGTPDLIAVKSIRDIKCSWDCFTFPLFDTEPNKGYWWQLQGYMSLTGKDVAFLDYVLMDTPESLIEAEVNRLSYREDITKESEQRIRDFHTYSHLPDSDRIKTFEIWRDDEAIKAIHERVVLCREYIKSLTS